MGTIPYALPEILLAKHAGFEPRFDCTTRSVTSRRWRRNLQSPAGHGDHPVCAASLLAKHSGFESARHAGILTLIGRKWEQNAAPVESETVKTIRAAIADRREAWLAEQLREIHLSPLTL